MCIFILEVPVICSEALYPTVYQFKGTARLLRTTRLGDLLMGSEDNVYSCEVKHRPEQMLRPPKFNIAPEKWWLEDYFPFGMAYFQGLY